MLELQTFLQTQTPAALQEKYGIRMKRHGQFPNLCAFKYFQIESPMGEKIVQESRGIILDEAQGWKVVARAYNKFFNAAEGHAAPLDWGTAKVQEKLDGSLCMLYFYAGEWRVATSGNPDASGNVNAFGFSFAWLFWQVWKELGYHLPLTEHDEPTQEFTFAFELLTPFNKIVVQHSKNRLVLHGARHPDLGEFQPEGLAYTHGWECVKSYPLTTLEDVMKSCAFIPPTEGEGYVVVDKNFNRIKVKSPAYVALAHLHDSMSPRNMLELVRSNEGSEWLAYFPEFKELHDQTKSKYDALVSEIVGNYSQYQGIESQKDFALAVKDLRGSGVYFKVRKVLKNSSRESIQKTVLEGLKEMTITNLEDILSQ